MQLRSIAPIAVLSLVVASLLVAGCTSSTTSQGTVSLKATQVTAPQAVGSPYTYTPKQGYKFVMYNVTVTNTASNSRNTHTTFFTVHDSDGNTYGISQATNDNSIAGYPNNVMINPGDKVTGLLVFEIPQNAKLVNMVYHDDYSSVTVNL
jgi:hypothetical protein